MLLDLGTHIQESFQDFHPTYIFKERLTILLSFYKHIAENSKIALFKELWVDKFRDWYLLTSYEN